MLLRLSIAETIDTTQFFAVYLIILKSKQFIAFKFNHQYISNANHFFYEDTDSSVWLSITPKRSARVHIFGMPKQSFYFTIVILFILFFFLLKIHTQKCKICLYKTRTQKRKIETKFTTHKNRVEFQDLKKNNVCNIRIRCATWVQSRRGEYPGTAVKGESML